MEIIILREMEFTINRQDVPISRADVLPIYRNKIVYVIVNRRIGNLDHQP